MTFRSGGLLVASLAAAVVAMLVFGRPALAIVGQGVQPAQRPRTLVPQARNPCPASFPARARSLNCLCPPGPYRRAVWGSYYYSAESGLCAAALHAGAIGPRGGSILVRAGPGRLYYLGSRRNGVASLGMGQVGRTIVFANATDLVEESRGRIALCRAKLSVYPAADRESAFTCRCNVAGAGFDGQVYGSGPYTADSSICTAARHAGALTGDDGLVTVSSGPGRDRYDPSTSNGVTSQYWDAYPQSMSVAAAPE